MKTINSVLATSNFSTINKTVTDDTCLTMTNLIRQRRHIDMFCALLGLLISIFHICILIYIRYWQKRKGFFLLFSQAILSILTLVLLLIGCLIDICLIKLSHPWIVFRAYVWLFLVNTLIAAYGFLVVVLCFDRFIALNNPLYYRITFVRLRVRVYLVSGSCVLAVFCCIKWLVFNHIKPDESIIENKYVTGSIWYIIIRTIATLIQYFISGIIMVVLSAKNAFKLRALDKAHFHELRMSDKPRIQWTKNHKTTGRICIFLAFSYIVFNWPYAITDYFYTDEIIQNQWYAVFEMIVNLSQILYIQLNMVFFSYCSKTYRVASITVLQKTIRMLRILTNIKRSGKDFSKHKKNAVETVKISYI